MSTKQIIDEVRNVVSNFKTYAKDVDMSKSFMDDIFKSLSLK